ncbi:hypothetical protein EVU96_08945 [Bacillus infantis]|uniref:hypothetical protein n=1 Tax=Bacillus infantis TaxID=324767 RepID=UPI00101C3D6E|nr:hypothetical protein [Bacillus infantis]RYI30531.1 hypothetical protein EVU96_08945 [Bacillus infantis]
MHEWIISYENDEALKEIKKTGIVSFEPMFEELKFIVMKTYLSQETILKINGVIECREPMTGTVFV